MLTVVGCLVEAHDFRLVALAAGICALSALTTVCLVSHAQPGCRMGPGGLAQRRGHRRRLRHLGNPLHRHAGLRAGRAERLRRRRSPACRSPSPSPWSGSGLSLSALVGGRAAAWARRRHPRARHRGDALHRHGRLRVAGHNAWDPATVALSLVLGSVLGGARAAQVGARGPDPRRCLPALLLLLAICSHHFIAMGAVTIMPDPPRADLGNRGPGRLARRRAWRSPASPSCSSPARRWRSTSATAGTPSWRRERLHSLANAAVEGLVVCRGDTIVSANDSFAQARRPAARHARGAASRRYLPGDATRLALASQPDQPVEAELPPRRRLEPCRSSSSCGRSTYAGRPHYAVAVRDLRARRQAESQIQFLAHHDALTGLANRASFSAAPRPGDASGAGDRAQARRALPRPRPLQGGQRPVRPRRRRRHAGRASPASSRRCSTTRQMMARLGGDEFAILVPVRARRPRPGGSPSASWRRCAPASERRRRSADRDQHRHRPLPRRRRRSAALLQLRRHGALPRQEGGPRHLPLLRGQDGRRGARAPPARARPAPRVARGEMQLVYQPQTDVGTGEVIGFEALLRWKHPERGDVSPAVFIPIAEESGAILQIGEWVLREACREAASWPQPLIDRGQRLGGADPQRRTSSQLVHEVLLETGLAPRPAGDRDHRDGADPRS